MLTRLNGCTDFSKIQHGDRQTWIYFDEIFIDR